jgi:hypothetical protein
LSQQRAIGVDLRGTAPTVGAGNFLKLSRKAIRQRFEQRFTAQRMTMDYLSLYHHMAVSPSLRVVT